ncbi:MAG: AAA family ATPase, partial [Deltaproteobacteria bacterium]|nr:AAA family ATPase [Deltaproteobacteria bacterium]
MSAQRLIKRYLQNTIQEDALSKSKMAFISGPRQCGKTTLVRSLGNKGENNVRYFTWDD